MYDVITVGSACIDLFVNTEDKLFRRPHNHGTCIEVPFGSKILINALHFDVGGGGTNTAVAFTRLGLKTAWIGKLGDDQHAVTILALLRKEGIDALVKKHAHRETGYSIILDAAGHDRTILAYKGCNDELLYAEVPQNINTKWLYFSSMLGKSKLTQENLAKFASRHNIKIMFNPSAYEARMGYTYMQHILKYTEILVLNQEEAELLSKKRGIMAIIKKLKSFGPKIIIITNGSGPAYCSDALFLYTLYPHKIKVIESTGAGDSFGAGFLAAFIRKADIELGLQVALANSQSVITHHGAKKKLLTWSEALEIVRKKPARLTKVLLENCHENV